MNYLIIKSIIEATLANFRCKNCDATVTEKDISILGSAGNALNLEIICPNCKVQGVVKAEIGMMNLPNIQNPEFTGALRQFIENFKKDWFVQPVDGIKDEDILNLRKNLQSGSSFEDLFKDIK